MGKGGDDMLGASVLRLAVLGSSCSPERAESSHFPSATTHRYRWSASAALQGGVDTERLGRMVVWGAAFAPLAHVWYGALDRMIPGKGALIVASKVAADQVRLCGRLAGLCILRCQQCAVHPWSPAPTGPPPPLLCAYAYSRSSRGRP